MTPSDHSAKDQELRLVSLTYKEATQGKTVALAGSFNDWDPEINPMTYSAETECYTCTIQLRPGTYEYKFVVDGEWVMDESNSNFAANDFGTLNSVLRVD